MKSIEKDRKNIDKLDKKIIKYLEKRFEIVLDIKKNKASNSISVEQRNREKEVIEKIKSSLTNKEDINFYTDIYEAIFAESKKYQYKRLAILGSDVEDSLSPVIYDFIAQKYNLNIVYEKHNIKDGATFYSYLQKLKNGKFDGFNITSPLKHYAFLIYDKVDDYGQTTESCNTIIYKDSMYHCYNTDYLGFGDFLEHNQIDTKDKKILILGNGATANTIYTYLLKSTLDITVCLRRESEHKKQFTKITYYDELKNIDSFDIVINATSSCEPISISDIEVPLYIDVNYKQIPQVNSKTKYFSGMQMLVYQAIYSSRIFFDKQEINLDNNEIMQVIRLCEESKK